MEQPPLDSRASRSSEQVAPLLPATAPAPEPARRINFLAALLLYWLVPKRIGPHLAVGTWKRAWAAHIIAVLLAAILPTLIVVGVGWLSPAGLQELRINAAQAVIMMAAGSSSVPSWAMVLIPLGAILVGELVLVLLAILFMPWCAGGDSAWSVFKRSLRNVYWSTTCWPLLAAGIAWIASLADQRNSWFHRLHDLPVLAVILLTIGAPVFLLIRALLVGASRYVGPPIGPAFKPREPLCDQCGYRITGLSLSTNCPECGSPVRDSLPGGRRKPTPWHRYSFQPRGILAAARLQWTVFRDRSFFDRLPVQDGLATARHFWWATLFFVLVAVMLFCGFVAPLMMLGSDRPESDLIVAKLWAAIIGLFAPLLLQVFLTFAACLWAQFRLGIRDYRISATVCYYASPLMWPTVAILVTTCVLAGIFPSRAFSRPPVLILLGVFINTAQLIALGILLILVVALVMWWSRLLGALRRVRYANV